MTKVKQTIIRLVSLALVGFTAYAALALRSPLLTATGFLAVGAFNFLTRTMFSLGFLIGAWLLCRAGGHPTLSWVFLALMMAAASRFLIQSSSFRKAIQAAGNDPDAVRRAKWDHDVSVQLWKLLTRRNGCSQHRRPW